MENPLKASSSTAGALLSGNTFVVPPFQREYAWQNEVAEFWDDLSQSVGLSDYFLGLIILTDEGRTKQVVDGQQRLITLTLLATALYHQALRRDRKALADRIQATFLRSIDYVTDETKARLELANAADNATLQHILQYGEVPAKLPSGGLASPRIAESFKFLSDQLEKNLAKDPFRKLGQWAEFLNESLYFAIFVHPDQASAYQVYEVINTRGRELTTADLLKSYVLSQTGPADREARYVQWEGIADQFSDDGSNNFVQYIRHAITVEKGHILPKELFRFLANRDKGLGRDKGSSRPAPTVPELMNILEKYLPLYLQLIDPTLVGPASSEQLAIFTVFNQLGVMTVRPMVLAVSQTPDALEGLQFILRLVVRRIVVGNLGTGNVERRFGEAARNVHREGDWRVLPRDLSDLNPSRDEFIERLSRRSFNKTTLAFLRKSALEGSMTPSIEGHIEHIWQRERGDWTNLTEEDGAFWASTIGNSYLTVRATERKSAESWYEFKERILPLGVEEEYKEGLNFITNWNTASIANMGKTIAQKAADVWY